MVRSDDWLEPVQIFQRVVGGGDREVVISPALPPMARSSAGVAIAAGGAAASVATSGARGVDSVRGGGGRGLGRSAVRSALGVGKRGQGKG